MQTHMVYKYIHAVVRSTKPRPPQYENLCIWQYWFKDREAGVFFPSGLARSPVKLPFCKGALPSSGGGFHCHELPRSVT